MEGQEMIRKFREAGRDGQIVDWGCTGVGDPWWASSRKDKSREGVPAHVATFTRTENEDLCKKAMVIALPKEEMPK